MNDTNSGLGLSTVELYSEATIYLYVALVVYPRHAELDDALRLNDHVDDALLDQLGSLCHYGLKGLQDLADCLVEFGLAWVAGDHLVHNLQQILVLNAHVLFLLRMRSFFASFGLQKCRFSCKR